MHRRAYITRALFTYAQNNKPHDKLANKLITPASVGGANSCAKSGPVWTCLKRGGWRTAIDFIFYSSKLPDKNPRRSNWFLQPAHRYFVVVSFFLLKVPRQSEENRIRSKRPYERRGDGHRSKVACRPRPKTPNERSVLQRSH